jgi:hypothetical protein
MKERTVYILKKRHGDNKLFGHWDDVSEKLFLPLGFTKVEFFDGFPAPIEQGLVSEIWYQSNLYKKLAMHLCSSPFKDGDLVIFENNISPSAYILFLLKEYKNVKVKFLSFWMDGVYDPDSIYRRSLFRKRRDWAFTFEKGLYACFDGNCFFTQKQLDRHNWTYIRRKSIRVKSFLTGLPFSLLGPEHPVDISEKENIVLIPYADEDKFAKKIYMGMQDGFPNYKFIQCGDMDRSEYKKLLRKAKFQFSAAFIETDPTLLFEGMLYGVVPILPDRCVFSQIFPDYYLYDSALTKTYKFYQVLEKIDIFNDMMSKKLSIYNQNTLEKTLEDSETIKKEYYNDNKFLTTTGIV